MLPSILDFTNILNTGAAGPLVKIGIGRTSAAFQYSGYQLPSAFRTNQLWLYQ